MTSLHPLPIASALTVFPAPTSVAFVRILVAIEEGGPSQKLASGKSSRPSDLHPLLGRALALAQPTRSELLVLTCLTEPVMSLPTSAGLMGLGFYDSYWSSRPSVDADRWQQTIQACEHRLQEQVRHATAQGIRAESLWMTGDPGRRICEQAKDWQADLVVIGRRGYRGLAEILLGSVSNYVLHHAPCTVLVVQ